MSLTDNIIFHNHMKYCAHVNAPNLSQQHPHISLTSLPLTSLPLPLTSLSPTPYLSPPYPLPLSPLPLTSLPPTPYLSPPLHCAHDDLAEVGKDNGGAKPFELSQWCYMYMYNIVLHSLGDLSRRLYYLCLN